MPVDWTNPNQIQEFKSAALTHGADPDQLEQFISSNSIAPPNPLVVPQMTAPKPLTSPSEPDALNIPSSIIQPQPSAPSATPPVQKPYDPTGKSQAQVMAETGQQSTLDQMNKNPTAPIQEPHLTPQMTPPVAPVPPMNQASHQALPSTQAPQMQNTVLPFQAPITQHAGNYNPNVEVYSKGYARDTNFAVPAGTPAALPPGTWKVINTYNQANPVGYLHNGENQGYGNDVVAVNTLTGDKIIEQHLSKVQAQPGQILQGGSIIGASGSSGNTTGPNLGIELTDKTGRIIDITHTPYMAGVMPNGRNFQGR